MSFKFEDDRHDLGLNAAPWTLRKCGLCLIAADAAAASPLSTARQNVSVVFVLAQQTVQQNSVCVVPVLTADDSDHVLPRRLSDVDL